MSDALQTPAFVREESDGTFTVVDRENGIASPTAYASLVAALDALRSLAGFVEADPTAAGSTRTRVPLRDAKTREEVGVWRWLDASAEESEPGPDGSRVTAAGIQSMAARLNADAEPAQIDGGVIPGARRLGRPRLASRTAAPSRAAGRTSVREWIDATGRSHLALFCEVFPRSTSRSTQERSRSARSVSRGRSTTPTTRSSSSTADEPSRGARLVPASAMRTATTTNGLRYARGPLTKVNIMTPDPEDVRSRSLRRQASLRCRPRSASRRTRSPTTCGARCGTPSARWKQGATLEKILEGGGARRSAAPRARPTTRTPRASRSSSPRRSPARAPSAASRALRSRTGEPDARARSGAGWARPTRPRPTCSRS